MAPRELNQLEAEKVAKFNVSVVQTRQNVCALD